MLKNFSRLGIGTAQFGMNYGINNKFGKVKRDIVYKILAHALDVGLNLIDTASSYKDAEKVLGGFEQIANFKIVSKFLNNEDPEDSLYSSLKKLKVKKVYALLAHRFESIKDDFVLSKLSSLKQRGLCEKIGVSLYYPFELEYILHKDIELDIVQVPYNVFDRRFEKYFSVLKSRGIEIHSRSVFLQGLFFLKPEELDPWFKDVKHKIKLLQDYAEEKGVILAQLLLGWVLKNKYIDRVIIGVDSYEQFLTNIELNHSLLDHLNFLDNFSENREKIIVPSLWRLRR